MGALMVAGCVLLTFGLPLAIFMRVIARDPLRIILFVLGAFFWLVSLLLSAFLWFAVQPLRDTLAFSLAFAVLFQELLRFLFFYLLKRAERGLEKVSQTGMVVAGVHPLKDTRHTTAMVCGLGFGVMCGLFGLVNVAADSIGSGVPGLPDSRRFGLNYQTDQYFFLFSSVCLFCVVQLNTLWTVVAWDGFHELYAARAAQAPYGRADIAKIAFVVGSHYLVSYLSLMNSYQQRIPYISLLCVLLLGTTLLSYLLSGGSWQRLIKCLLLDNTGSAQSSSQTPATARVEVVANPRATDDSPSAATASRDTNVVVR